MRRQNLSKEKENLDKTPVSSKKKSSDVTEKKTAIAPTKTVQEVNESTKESKISIKKNSDQKVSQEIQLELDPPVNTTILEQLNLSEHSVELLERISPYSNSKLTVLEEKIKKNIWTEQHTLETIAFLFDKACNIPNFERETSLIFGKSLAAIDAIVEFQCSVFEYLLEENNKNGLS